MNLHFERHISLKPYNTFGIDAKANTLFRLQSVNSLPILQQSPEYHASTPLYWGGGSNIVLNDGTLTRLVIKNELSGITCVESKGDCVWVEVAAGENWHQFVMFALKKGWYGLENLSLIPGTVGAAPVQNIGAYGVEIQEKIDRVICIDLLDNPTTLISLSAEKCQFGYRDSIFKSKAGQHLLIVAVRFCLSTLSKTNTRYFAIQTQLKKMGIAPDASTPKQVAEAVIAMRRTLLPDPLTQGNVGSFFKNPVVSATKAKALLEQYPNMPVYPLANGLQKLAAGWLIEQAGLKGFRVGDVAVHEQHALVLVNLGQATGQDVRKLAQHIQTTVYDFYHVMLESEPVFIDG